MEDKTRIKKVVSRGFLLFGILTIAVAVLHLIVTLVSKADSSLSFMAHFGGSILLGAIGINMLISVPSLNRGEHWGWRINLVQVLAILLIPFCALILLLRGHHFSALGFTVAMVTLAIVGVGAVALLLWSKAEYLRVHQSTGGK
jgi:hypothetical protein